MRRAALMVAVAGLVPTVGACTIDGLPSPPAAPARAQLVPAAGIFGAASFFRTDIRSAPVAASSGAEVAGLAAQVRDVYGGVAAFNAHSYDVAVTIAPAGTRTTNVTFVDCQHKGYEPAGLAAQLAGVPIPADARPADGTDHGLTIWQPSTDRLWEIWQASRTASGWQGCYGGRLDHVSHSPGYFGGGFGQAATGIALSGGMVRVAEARAGHIDHALSLALRNPATYTRVSWPAQRSDGSATDPAAIPEGTRLRLDPALDVDALPGLTPVARMIAHAAQTYGFVVTDRGGAVSVSAESGAAEQSTTGVDPWLALERGVPDYAVLAHFPWDRLQALPTSYGKPRG